MCECYQTGGRFIDVDPDCPVHGAGGLNETMQEQADTIARLKAEVKRLRAALEDLLSAADALPSDTVDPHSVRDARAALKEGET